MEESEKLRDLVAELGFRVEELESILGLFLTAHDIPSDSVAIVVDEIAVRLAREALKR